MKKQSNLSRLLEIAGSHKYLTYASWVLSAISALIALVPFYYIWKMIKEVLEVAPDFGQAQNLIGNGWMAVLFAVLAVLVYIAGLMCSHLGAFRIATNLRIQTMEHTAKNDAMTMVVALSYSSRWEILNATKKMVKE